MTLFAEVNGNRLVSGTIAIPHYGAWVADVTLATPLPLSGDPKGCSLVLGGLALTGTAYRGSPFAGARLSRLVGGAGGWRKDVDARAYYLPGGIALSLVLGDAARETGESIKLDSDPLIGSYFTREHAPASRLLRTLVDLWWIDPDGTTRVADARPSAVISSEFQVIAWDGGRGWFQIATETVQDWLPGNTFTAPTVPTAQTISLTTIKTDAAGVLRVEVLTKGAVES